MAPIYLLKHSKQQRPPSWQLRRLVGVVIPGKVADLQIFMVISMGHGKGLLAYKEEINWVWGIRIGLFKQSLVKQETIDKNPSPG
ncbi:MAG: hypothetical protein GY847_03420 [Proteobacteria bacterium]|nr:hypothetical protein [Pseudomonadota bacterium]